ncbi:MAG TPA: hypothetical protein VN641_21985 [Urbifossiella sp.]|nr:hypothetical protein [Urbifossiella sp.]
MSFPEVLDAVKSLDRREKVQLMQSLREEIGEPTDEELIAKHFPPGETFEIWTPLDCQEGAAMLLQLLEKEKGKLSNE